MSHVSLRPVLSIAAWMILHSASVARANEVLAEGASGHGLVIHDATETRERYCATDSEGRLWLTLPGGARYELVTSTSDPRISNPGDGSFHPFEAAELRAALGDLDYPLGPVRADVFVLPYPRRSGLESAAGPRLILLSPGVRPLSREQQHAEFVHELGHVVQYALMPDSDSTRWTTYRRMRGILDDTKYSAGAIHADRPHEIFAEDFRALFGGATANYSGTIENSELDPPSSVTGLRDFLRGLGATQPMRVDRVAATPNPARGAIRFSLARAAAVPLDLFDAAGRRIATLVPSTFGAGVEWTWDGTDARGGRVGPGVLFARPRGAGAATVRVTVTE